MLGDVTYHHIHPHQLRPHLDRHAQHHSIEHPWLGKCSHRVQRRLALEAEHLLNLAVLSQNVRVADIAVAVQVGKYPDGLLPAILSRKPSGRVGKEKHAHEENGSRHNLNRPWDAECRCALVNVIGPTAGERGSVLDEVLDQDAPCNGPLLQRDHSPTDLLGCLQHTLDRRSHFLLGPSRLTISA